MKAKKGVYLRKNEIDAVENNDKHAVQRKRIGKQSTEYKTAGYPYRGYSAAIVRAEELIFW